jgi:hypothetical protein
LDQAGETDEPNSGMALPQNRKNRLSPETAAYIINSHLKPKLEYRMRIIPKQYDLVKWDRSIHGAVNATINPRVEIKREALRRTLNIQFPSEYNTPARINALSTTLNAQSSASTTTKDRITNPAQKARVIDPRDLMENLRSNPARIQPQRNNRNQETIQEAETHHGLTMTDNSEKKQDIFPKHLPPDAHMFTVNIKGKTYGLPDHHWGTWGHRMQEIEVDVYTDGSKNEPDPSHPTRINAAWAAILHDDNFDKHWAELHESNGRIHRTRQAARIPSWSGTLAQDSPSSYLPELEAITRMAMILPSAWKVTIWTDSESAMKAVEHYNPNTPAHKLARKAGWTLLETFIHTNNNRKNPISLQHISSHEQKIDPRSVGNATADLMAKNARITQKPSKSLNTAQFAQKYNWQYRGQTLDSAEKLKEHIHTEYKRKLPKWNLNTSSQAHYINHGFKAYELIESLRKQLKYRHMGTLADVFTGSIFLRGWRTKKEDSINCQYCLQVRGVIKALTPEHLTQCSLNKHAKKAAKMKVQQRATEGWKVDWETHTEKVDHMTQMAQRLVDHTNLIHTNKTARIWNPARNIHSKEILHRTLDDLAYQYCQNALSRGETPSNAAWQQSIADLVDTKYPEASLPRSTQTLAARLIDATTDMSPTKLPSSKGSLTHTVTERPNHSWGHKQMTHPDIRDSNYHYAPHSKQKRELAKAHTNKRTGKTPKSLGFVNLNPENISLLKKLNLAHIATIPKGAIKMHTASPNPQYNQEPVAIILGVSKESQSREDIDTLTAAHIITDWTKKTCPKATIHYADLIEELSGGHSQATYTTASWQAMVEDTWDWIDTPEAYAGLPTQTHADKIMRLKGSTISTKKLIMGAAAILFKQFAQDWEAKMILAPQPIPWNKQRKQAPRPPPPDRPEESDSEEEDDKEDDDIQQREKEINTTISNSKQLLHQAMESLIRSGQPKAAPKRTRNHIHHDHPEREETDPAPPTPKATQAVYTASPLIQPSTPSSRSPSRSSRSPSRSSYKSSQTSSASSPARPKLTPAQITPTTPTPSQLLQRAYEGLLPPKPQRPKVYTQALTPAKDYRTNSKHTTWTCNWCYFTTNEQTHTNCEICNATRDTYQPVTPPPQSSALNTSPPTPKETPTHTKRRKAQKHSRSKPPHHTTNPD